MIFLAYQPSVIKVLDGKEAHINGVIVDCKVDAWYDILNLIRTAYLILAKKNISLSKLNLIVASLFYQAPWGLNSKRGVLQSSTGLKPYKSRALNSSD